MAKRRSRRSSRRPNGSNVRTDAGGITGALAAAIASSKMPQVLSGAANGLEAVAVSALQLARNVLVTAVSGAAEIGTEAVTATVSGARSVVAAASRMVGDIATTAQTTLQDAMRNASWSRNGGARTVVSSRSAPASESNGAEGVTSPSTEDVGPRRRRGATRKRRRSTAAEAT